MKKYTLTEALIYLAFISATKDEVEDSLLSVLHQHYGRGYGRDDRDRTALHAALCSEYSNKEPAINAAKALIEAIKSGVVA